MSRESKNTDKIDEALIILMEECAEVAQVASKAWRFGLDHTNPILLETNKELLSRECGDLKTMIDILLQQGALDDITISLAELRKVKKLKKWSSIYD